MTQALQTYLSIHVLIGVTGIMASYMTLMWLFKREIPLKSLKFTSLLAFLTYITTWITGGYYYVVYYGGNVKPIIKEGPTPWVHLIIMEVKEHIFLFLPLLSFVILLVLWMKGDKLSENKKLRNALALVALITFLIALFMALGGVLISGSAR